MGETVKLTVVHDDFEPGSAVLELISGGWPAILANLKTLLETGATLPPAPGTEADETGLGEIRRTNRAPPGSVRNRAERPLLPFRLDFT